MIAVEANVKLNLTVVDASSTKTNSMNKEKIG